MGLVEDVGELRFFIRFTVLGGLGLWLIRRAEQGLGGWQMVVGVFLCCWGVWTVAKWAENAEEKP